MGDHLALLGSGAGLCGRGHEVRAEIFEGLPPQLTVFDGSLVGFEFIEGHFALVHAIAVAIKAVSLQDGPNISAKLSRAGTFSSRRAEQESSNPQQGQRPGAGLQMESELHDLLLRFCPLQYKSLLLGS
jgi:hypothetical protein